MEFKQCPQCGELFSREKWRKAASGEYQCWRCNNFFDVDAIENEASANHLEAEELAAIPNLLNNLEFLEAENRLEELTKKYPKNPKVYFLKVLAAHCINYIHDEDTDRKAEKWVPTLNNISAEPLSALTAYKMCLDLAKGEEKEHYLETFKFIEDKRQEVLDDYGSGKYTYDVFISTKVTEMDFSNPAHPVPLLANGEPVISSDAKLASSIYDQLRHDNPRLSVFYSEREKDAMAGQRFENVIFSALHTAKVFILVASDINHINWRWVRNEWKRYLYLMDPSQEGYKNRHIILVGNGLAKAELPYELKKREFIDFQANQMGALNLIKFVNTSLMSGQAYEKLKAKSFDTSVASLDRSALEAETLQTTTLGVSVVKLDAGVEKQAKFFIKNTKDDDPYARKDAFARLKDFSSKHPEVYAAKIQLLMEKTPFMDVDEYFGDAKNIADYPEVASQFLTLAEKEDAIKRLEQAAKGVCKLLAECASASRKSSDSLRIIRSVSKDLLHNNLANLSKATTNAYLKQFAALIDSHPANCDDQTLIEEYLYLHLYCTDKDPEKYVAERSRLLYRFEKASIADYLINEILRIDPGNYNAIWVGLVRNLTGSTATVEHYLDNVRAELYADEAPKKSYLSGPSVAGNKKMLEAFNSLFLYSPKEKKATYLQAFLLTLVLQKSTCDYQGGKGEGDEALSGYDLFKKYVAFDMSLAAPYCPTKESLKSYYERLRYDAFALKKDSKITALDEALCAFAVKLHENGQYSLAIDVYNLYLAQQTGIGYLDTIVIRYYATLAGSNCASPEDLIYSPQKFDYEAIGFDLSVYEGREYDAFGKFMSHLERDRSKYQATYDEVKKIFTLRPAACFSALPKLEECQREIEEKFKAVEDSGVSKELIDTLRKDLDSELSTLRTEVKGITAAKKTIDKCRPAVDKILKEHEAKTMAQGHGSHITYTTVAGNILSEEDEAKVRTDIKRVHEAAKQWGSAGEVDELAKWEKSALSATEVLSTIRKDKIAADAERERRIRHADSKREARARARSSFSRVAFTFLGIALPIACIVIEIFSGFLTALYSPLVNGELFRLEGRLGLEGLYDFITYSGSNIVYMISIVAISLLGSLCCTLAGGHMRRGGYRAMTFFSSLPVLPLLAYSALLLINGIYCIVILGLLNGLTCACLGSCTGDETNNCTVAAGTIGIGFGSLLHALIGIVASAVATLPKVIAGIKRGV
ncbi:MAG: TIR domain-containing protein [Bacilli bacterium]|nr:TIR domain-containing protein [Bacilli bacterium]